MLRCHGFNQPNEDLIQTTGSDPDHGEPGGIAEHLKRELAGGGERDQSHPDCGSAAAVGSVSRSRPISIRRASIPPVLCASTDIGTRNGIGLSRKAKRLLRNSRHQEVDRLHEVDPVLDPDPATENYDDSVQDGPGPVAVKDAFAVNGLRQHLGPTRDVVSERDALAVRKLSEAGAVVIGTTAMDQLAWTMTGQAPGYTRCDNPLLPGRSPGGSSGGAAAAVAAGIVPLAVAVDPAGSVRVPAAWCGAVWFKPSSGAIDLDGCAPLAPCLDTAGIVARHVDDCRLAFGVLSTGEPEAPVRTTAPRLGIPASLTAEAGCDAGVLAIWGPHARTHERRCRGGARGQRASGCPGCRRRVRGESRGESRGALGRRPWSVFGWPAISVPCPDLDVPGYGMQLVARPGEDMSLLGWAGELEELMRNGSKVTGS